MYIIVIAGFVMTFLMSYWTAVDWGTNPTSTSVAQIPIESIIFPAITVCPLLGPEFRDNSNITDDTQTRKLSISDFHVENAFKNCSFTKDNKDTGKVCDGTQVCTY